MTCVHLRKLYQLCQDDQIKLSGADLIHIVCEKCGVKEVCPSVLMDEYDSKPHGEVPDQSLPAQRTIT